MTDHSGASVTPEPPEADEGEADIEAEIDGSAPEELDSVVDSLPGSGKLDTDHGESGNTAGGPVQLP